RYCSRPMDAANPIMTAEKKTTAPEWFTRVIAMPSEDRFLEVEGCRIHYLRWGQTGKPGLLFVHGGYAHAHWWDVIAPFFAADHCVAAIGLSGMGESGYRRKYTAGLYAKEEREVCSGGGVGGRQEWAGR